MHLSLCRKLTLGIFLPVYFFAAAPVFSQQTVFYDITKLDVKSGLISPNVRKIIQDPYGFMWIATQDGLNRFDGVDFIRFNSGAQPGKRLLGSDVFDLLADKDSSFIWALTAYGGLNRIDAVTSSVLQRYTLPSDLSSTRNWWFKCMADGGDHLFIGTDEGSLIAFDKRNGLSTISVDLHRRPGRSGPIDRLFLDRDGRLWLFIPNVGISRIDTASGREVNFTPLQQLGFSAADGFQFTAVCAVGDYLFIGTTAGLAVLDLRTFRIMETAAVLPQAAGGCTHQPILALSYDGGRLTIAGKEDFLLMDLARGSCQRVLASRTADDNAWLGGANCIYQTRESIWIGSTYGVALVRNIHTPFTGFYCSMDLSGVKINHATTLCKINDSINFVCADDGLYRSNEQSGRVTRVAGPDFFYSAFRVPGGLVIGSGKDKGTRLFDETGRQRDLRAEFPELTPVAKDLLISDARQSDSLIYMASQNERGIYIWNTIRRTLALVNTDSGYFRLKSNVINRLFFDSHGKLWIVGDVVVSVCDPRTGAIEHLPLLNPITHQPLSINMDICEVNGHYFLTVYGVGIVELDEAHRIRKIYGLEEGVSNLGLYKIFPVNDSLVLASSNNGLSMVNLHTGHVTNFYEEDGLQSDNFEEASGTVYKNALFLGGIHGYTRIDKAALAQEGNDPPMYFSTAAIQTEKGYFDTLNIGMRRLTIPNDALKVSIGYTALDYLHGKTTLFRYKIKELTESWIYNGNQRSIPLTGISPGTYTLLVESSGAGGRWNDHPITMALIFLPKWYQTSWFKLLLAILGAGLIYSVFYLRLQQLKAQQQIRREIAGDLHDDIGATLNSLKMLTHLVHRENPASPQLDSMEQTLGEAIVRVRDTIWVLDDKADTFNDLFEKLKKFALPVSVARRVQLEWVLSEELKYRRLGKKEKKNLHLIAKEAINNAFKYAGCTVIRIALETGVRSVVLTVSDNGKGFDAAAVTEGYGLKNMHYRARQIWYRVALVSVPGEGTTIRVSR